MLRFNKQEFEMDFFGYKTCEIDLEFDSDYEECIRLIDNAQIEKHIPNIKRIMICRLKSIVEKNFKLMFNTLNLEVKQMNEKDFGIYLWNDKDTNNLEKKAKKISAFKVPTYYDNTSGCFYNFSTFDLRTPILINKITITKDFSEIFYAHEICHALLNRNKGIIENYMHAEFVSIFVELLYSYIYHGKNTLYEDVLIRFENIKKSFYASFGSSQIERDIYIVSTLLAFDAFFKYINFSNILKLEMMKDLERVLNGNLILEDYFKKYEIQFNKETTNKMLTKTIEYSKKR